MSDSITDECRLSVMKEGVGGAKSFLTCPALLQYSTAVRVSYAHIWSNENAAYAQQLGSLILLLNKCLEAGNAEWVSLY